MRSRRRSDGEELKQQRAKTEVVEAIAAAVIASIMIVWTWPALMVVHRTMSPPFETVEWLRVHVNPRSSKVFVHDSMQPMCDALLDDFPRVNLGDHPPLLTGAMHEGDVYVREGMSVVPGAVVFERPRGRIASMVRNILGSAGERKKTSGISNAEASRASLP